MSGILNLAVGDFAMVGELGVDDLVQVWNWPAARRRSSRRWRWPWSSATPTTGWCSARAGRRRQLEDIVITFFFTFALSLFIDGVAKILFGTDVHAASALWTAGRSPCCPACTLSGPTSSCWRAR